jgi:hypothetical protein
MLRILAAMRHCRRNGRVAFAELVHLQRHKLAVEESP